MENNSTGPQSGARPARWSLSRRGLLKALAGLPFLAALGFSTRRKWVHESAAKDQLISGLGLKDVGSVKPPVYSPVDQTDLLRVGIIGFGWRGEDLAASLGFKHPEQTEMIRQRKKPDPWLEQPDLNVAITGICDVFDLHAERGLAAAGNPFVPWGERPALPVKRYRHYRDMLNDPEIDGVIIATPDFHHARITIEAMQAGKHVYCEKSGARTFDEAKQVYEVVKNSRPVYQLGHQYTKNAVFSQAKEIINKGILGDISLIETTTNRNTAHGAWVRHLDANGQPKPGDERSIDWDLWLGDAPGVPFSIERFYSWTKWWDYNNGLFAQLFSHEYDAINQLLRIGIPSSVVASGGIYFWDDGRDTPDVLNCIFEYPGRKFTLKYSATLSNSRSRGRIIMGSDASMELGSSLIVYADGDSRQFADKIREGIIEPGMPLLANHPGSEGIDAITTATEKYYAARGLTTTVIGGRVIDINHLHLKEWIDCIRFGGVPTSNIERFYEEAMTNQMAITSYKEKRRVEWDPVNQTIV